MAQPMFTKPGEARHGAKSRAAGEARAITTRMGLWSMEIWMGNDGKLSGYGKQHDSIWFPIWNWEFERHGNSHIEKKGIINGNPWWETGFFTSSGCTRSHLAQHLLGCAAVWMSPMVTSNTPRFLEINMAKHGETLVLKIHQDFWR